MKKKPAQKARARETRAADRPSLPVFFSLFAGFFSFLIYCLTLNRSLGGGDSGELTMVAQSWGVAHPPGYPLFSLLGRLFTVAPWGEVAARVNVLSALADAGAVFFLALAVARWTRDRWATLSASLLFAFSPLVWTYATVAEVFALNNLFVAGLLYASVRFRETGERKVAYLGALWIGLGMSNHHAFAFFAIPAIAAVIAQGRRTLGARGIAVCVGMVFVGLFPYLTLPWASARLPAVAWGDQTTWEGFWTHFLRREYGTLSLASSSVASATTLTGTDFGALGRVGSYLAALAGETLGIGWGLAIWGARAAIRKDRYWAWGLIFTLVAYLTVFSALSNLPLEIPLYRTIQSRFWQQANVLVFFGIGVGIAASQLWAKRALPALAALAVLLQLGVHYRERDQSRDRVFEEFARAVLTMLPERALLLTSGDTVSYGLQYYQRNAGLAPQARLVDFSILSYPWSGRVVPQSAPGVSLPGSFMNASRPGTYTFKDFLDANAPSRPIFVVNGTQSADPRFQAAYSSWPVGLVEMLLPKEVEPALHEWRRNSEQMWAQTPYDKWKTHPSGTWEHELYRLALTQRYRYGLKLLYYAGRHGNDASVAAQAAGLLEEVAASPVLTTPPELFLKSYRLYRHLGLAYQMMAARDPAARTKMIDAWKRFLRDAAPDEEDAAAIRSIVAQG